jgi:hypothetical protein
MRRRGFVTLALFGGVVACVRPAPRAPDAETPAVTPPGADTWRNEAQAILSDGLQALQTLTVFAAFRISNATSSDLRSLSELPWDPPTSADWDEATHNARALHGRAEHLLQTISTSQVEASYWRERRDRAEAANGLIEMSDAIAAYRDRIDHLFPGGDSSGTLDALDRAWTAWDSSAAAWGVRRSELLGCVLS